MKKKYLLAFLMFPLLLSSCSYNIKEASYADMIDKKDNNESFTFFIGTSSCSACKSFRKEISKAYNKLHYRDTIYYVDGLDIERDYLQNVIKQEFNSCLPDQFYVENSMYSKDGFYTPSIFRYYKGVLVYSKIEGVSYNEVPYLTNNNYINIGYYDNIDKLAPFNNYVVYIYSSLPTLNESSSTVFYILQEHLSADQKSEIKLLYNTYNEEIDELKDTIKITYENNVIINVE